MDHFQNLIRKEMPVRELESGIHTSLEKTDNLNSYDGSFGDFYDMIACNPIYNRVIWGYSSGDFTRILKDELNQKEGPVLDAGCGSLAFTHRFYSSYKNRPVVFLDQSLKLLRMAHKRVSDTQGNLPDHFLVLQGDAFALPFQQQTFTTVVSMNLLHTLSDMKPFLASLDEMVLPGGNMLFTTLILNHRFGDSILKKWDKAGEVVARTEEDLRETFQEMGYSVEIKTKGNMAFLKSTR